MEITIFHILVLIYIMIGGALSSRLHTWKPEPILETALMFFWPFLLVYCLIESVRHYREVK